MPRSLNQTLLAYLQVSADIVLVTVLVYLTGGIDSGLSILYHMTIITASIILYRRGGYLSASLSSILYGGMLDMQYYDVPGFIRSQNFTAIQVFYQIFINIFSFYTVAFLSSNLSDRLRKAKQELQEKNIDFEDLRNQQDLILKSVASGILTMDLAGHVTSLNPAAEYITGYAGNEIRQRVQDIFGESIKQVFGHTDEMRERAYRFEGRITKKDGGTAVLGMSASLLKDDRGTVRGIILVFQDITKLIEMEEKVRRQERMATVGSLAAGIAHEIRNPLASLSGSIQLLQSDLDPKGDSRRLMDIVLHETDRLNTIISEFLEYARPRNIHKELISLADVIDETVLLLRNSPDFRETMTITVDTDPSLRLKADPQQLRQVFWNMLLNACQAMHTGGTIIISAKGLTSADEGVDWCEITISDTGCGISPEDMKNLFDPFFTTKHNGTGLGLAIVYRIVEDHDGMIDVESEVDKGTRFTIRIPLEGLAMSTLRHSPGERTN
ncbi:MAG TPA: ATP-binding protein [Nitrospirota bacterium]|nr:ATP-binding protein [Nitrospirota bacterium]